MLQIYAIVLAAGESKRMGSPKMLLDFGGKTMLEAVISNVSKSGITNIIVVLGAHREKLESLVKMAGAAICYNENYQNGMLSSVQCGFRNIPEGTEAVLVFQGDQPLITPEVIRMVLDTFRKSDKGLIIPVFQNRRGHPLLISEKYFKEIEKLDPSRGLKSLSEIFYKDVVEVQVNDMGILRDFDTFEDYIKEFKQI
jgi:molybdenum cofactor cytidylyltransferase